MFRNKTFILFLVIFVIFQGFFISTPFVSAAYNSNYDYNEDTNVDHADTLYLVDVFMGIKTCPEGKICDIDGDGDHDRFDNVDFVDLVNASRPTETDLNSLDLAAKKRVRGVYFIPSDREFPPGIQERLNAFIDITQDFYREEMEKYGYLA